jgi:succinate-semialdehyde dehydrogenase/glutarate-semialdehyde dehydrogenase
MNRLLLHESIADEFLAGFVERSRRLAPGDPADPDTTLGPVISADARDRLRRWLSEARAGGGKVLLGDDQPDGSAGHFVSPAIVLEPTPESRISCEEVFGPVVGVWTFADEEEALALANRNLYGLAAYLCSADLGRATRVAERLHAGIVGVNDAGPTTPEAPFGGIGLSGHGKEGGHQGLDEFLEHKYVSTRLPDRS